MLGFQKLQWSYERTNQPVLTFWNILLRALSEARTQKWKRGGLQKHKTKKKHPKTLHAKRGGLFRCQEVCVMVMGQMREEGWSRPLYFEDSPPPPRPVQLHHCNPTPKPRNRQDQRGLTFVCTCLCMHLFWSVIFFQGFVFNKQLDSCTLWW